MIAILNFLAATLPPVLSKRLIQRQTQAIPCPTPFASLLFAHLVGVSAGIMLSEILRGEWRLYESTNPERLERH
jgi:hypothetical protein